MWNILPQISGVLISRHLRVSYRAGVKLAILAHDLRLRIRRELDNPRPAQSVPVLTLRYGGLRIKIERIAIGVDIWCSVYGSTADIARDVTDMRTVLRYIYENRQEYRNQELEWWNIGDKYQYPDPKRGTLWKLK